MKTFIALMVMTTLAGQALALMDDGDNSLGIYFDATGDQNYPATPLAPFVPFNLYFVLANPMFETIGGFEFAWRIDPELVPAPVILSMTLPPNALNLGDNMNLLVGLGTPYTTSAATILATANVMLMAPPAENYLTAGPATPASIPGHCAFNDGADPSDIQPMNFSTVDGVDVIVDAEGWVSPGLAALSFIDVVPTAASTWGTVKALFD